MFLPGLTIHYRMTEVADFHNDPNQITWTIPVKCSCANGYYLKQRKMMRDIFLSWN